MNDAQRLETLKNLLDENGCGAMSDELLCALLEKAGGDLGQALYLCALYRAQNDQVTTPDGLSAGSNREYWLGVARAHRPSHGGTMPRAYRRDAI